MDRELGSGSKWRIETRIRLVRSSMRIRKILGSEQPCSSTGIVADSRSFLCLKKLANRYLMIKDRIQDEHGDKSMVSEDGDNALFLHIFPIIAYQFACI